MADYGSTAEDDYRNGLNGTSHAEVHANVLLKQAAELQDAAPQALSSGAAARCQPSTTDNPAAAASVKAVMDNMVTAMDVPKDAAQSCPHGEQPPLQPRSPFPPPAMPSTQVSADILSIAENDRCFDCAAALLPSDAWASVSHGCTLCLACAGLHRALGVHLSFVRSLALDGLKPLDIAALREGGNKRFRLFLEQPEHAVRHEVWLAMPIEMRYQTPVADLYRRRLRATLRGEEPPSELARIRPPPPPPPPRPRAWTPDEEADACELCRTSFTFFVRRHHCRKCGRCVCNDCAPPDCNPTKLELSQIGFVFWGQKGSWNVLALIISEIHEAVIDLKSARPLPELGYAQPCRQCRLCVPPTAKLMPGMGSL